MLTKTVIESIRNAETAFGKWTQFLAGKDVDPYCNFTLLDLCNTALALTEIKIRQEAEAELAELRKKLEQAKKLFSSISCLYAEGVEFYTSREILDSIAKEASKGYNICGGCPNTPYHANVEDEIEPDGNCGFC